MSSKELDIDTRLSTLQALREERDSLVAKRTKKDNDYLLKYGKKKDHPTPKSEREIELRRLIRRNQNAVYQKQRRIKYEISKAKQDEIRKKEEELDRIIDDYLEKKEKLVKKEKALKKRESKLEQIESELKNRETNLARDEGSEC